MFLLIVLGMLYEVFGSLLADTIEGFLNAEDKEEWIKDNRDSFIRMMLWTFLTGLPYLILIFIGILGGYYYAWILLFISLPTISEKSASRLYNYRSAVTFLHCSSLVILFLWARSIIYGM